jgi:DNA-binding CsgD family transcriptional regulator
MGTGHAHNQVDRLATSSWKTSLAASALLLASAMFLHEAGNYYLVGSPLDNNRTFSCLSHRAGLISGLAVCYLAYAKLPFRKPLLLSGLLLLHAACIAVFYASLGATTLVAWTVPAQFIASFTATVCALGAIEDLQDAPARRFSLSVLCVIGGAAFLTYVPFELSFRTETLFVPVVFHGLVLLTAIAFALFAAVKRRRHQPASAPIANRRRERMQGNDGIFQSPEALLFLCIASYGIATGLFHAIPLGLPMPPVMRAAPLFSGLCCALLLIWATFRSNWMPAPASFWRILCRTVFPLATISSILVPLTFTWHTFPPVLFAAAASFYFEFLLAIGCCSVWHKTKVAASKVFCAAFLAYFVGSILGTTVGAIAYPSIMADEAHLNLVTIVVFLLLFSATFMTKAERYAKTVWGFLPKEPPREYRESRIATRCEQLASDYGLTERELDVLRLLACGKRAGEISSLLVVSVNTTRTHIKSIYAKLEVHSVGELSELIGLERAHPLTGRQQ